jgi:hypothetical protein
MERLVRLGSMLSRARNLAEYSSWETDGSGDYWRSPSTTLFDDFLEIYADGPAPTVKSKGIESHMLKR